MEREWREKKTRKGEGKKGVEKGKEKEGDELGKRRGRKEEE